VQPPEDLLSRLLAVRVHLDDCTADNGPLRVVPGTHLLDRITEEDALRLRDEIGDEVCVVPAGGALLMRPLLLHASGKAVSERPRRVLHFVYGPPRPHASLAWPEDAASAD
jgi:ectoine hydroxylase-related dioxygenase (phytanoyl-CoA dioxygenase family)